MIKLSAKYMLFFLFINLFFINFSFATKTHNPTNNFLVLSDVHLARNSTHEMEIAPAKYDPSNDLDSKTFTTLLDTLNKNIQNGTVPTPQFILLLGDIVGHDRTASTDVSNDESAVFTQLKSVFPTIPIFYVFGNNDSFDSDYGPFTDNKLNSPYKVATQNNWADGFLSTGTQCDSHAIFPCLVTENTTDGYYAAYLQPKLRLIALNTVLLSAKRVDVTEEAAQTELKWLEDQLKTATANQESVLIAAHIPPGKNIFDHSPFLVDEDNAAFLKILQTYKNIIMGVLVGHTHMEELKVIKDANNQNTGEVLFTAGFSTSHGNAPSVKTFYFSQNNNVWNLTNYTAFNFTTATNLQALYDFTQYYCATNVRLHSIFDCLDKVSASKIATYYTAGNKNFKGSIDSPDDVFIRF